jgi:hypothetical protein
MYVLVRRDLSFPYQAVQSAHAAIEAARQFIPPSYEHPHLVLLGVSGEQELLSAARDINHVGIDCKIFREEDIGNQATALATECISGRQRRFFSGYKLLSNPSSKETCND